jgi:hypothetical protein
MPVWWWVLLRVYSQRKELMMALKLLLLPLLILSIAGCLSSAPTDSMVLSSLEKNDPLVGFGCVKYENFQRINGFDRGNSYIVTYRVNQVMVISQDVCMSKMMTESSKDDPLKALAVLGSMWDNMGVFVEFSMNGGRRIVEGDVTFIKSEKGWVFSN